MLKGARARVLYITYLGLLEPIPQSQVLPYLYGLSKDADIHLLSFEKMRLIKEKYDEFQRIKKTLWNKKIIWHRLPYHKTPRVLSSFFDIFIGTIFCLWIVIRCKISIIHARSNIPIAIAFILKDICRIKILYDRRGIMGEDHLEYSGWKRNGLLYRFSKRWEVVAMKASDSIVVLTQRMHSDLSQQAIFSQKNRLIRIIPCCVDVGHFKYNPGKNSAISDQLGLKDKFVFIYSGSIGTYNLIDEMIDFFKVGLGIIPSAHFLVLTHTPDPILNVIANTKVKQRISVESVNRELIPQFYSAADVGLVFRKSSLTARASSPTKFAEYLSCGLPVIVGPGIGDLEEIVDRHKVGVVLKEYNFSEYKDALKKIKLIYKKDPDLRTRCRQTAKEVFSLDSGVEKYLEIYNQLIHNKARGKTEKAMGAIL